MYLTDLQKVKIEAFCADKEMVEAVRKVLLATLYEHGTVQESHTPDPQINGAFKLVGLAMENPIPDAELGAHLRGTWAGINLLKQGLDRLETIKTGKSEVESPYNEAI